MKKNSKTKEEGSKIRLFIGKIIVIFLILNISYGIIRNSVYVPYILKKNPACIKARIYKDYYAGIRLGRRMAYSFMYNDIEYSGSMKEMKNLGIGDSICIVFLKSSPDINRPLSYFDQGKIKCNCK